MRALIDDAPTLEHDHAIHIGDGRQTMRDDDRRHLHAKRVIDCGLDALFDLGI